MQIVKFTKEYLKEVADLEKICFPTLPWSEGMFLAELENELCSYFLAKIDNKVIGYVGMWCVAGEGQITNIAVLPDFRRQGVAKRLLDALFLEAKNKNLEVLTLEVRASNTPAITLYEKYGFLSFGGNEIYGVDPEDDSGVLEGNSVAYALNDREENNLPKEWIPIYNFDDGNMAYLDYSSLNEEKEPSVIMAFHNEEKYEIVEKLAEDFGDFVLQLVQEQVEE